MAAKAPNGSNSWVKAEPVVDSRAFDLAIAKAKGDPLQLEEDIRQRAVALGVDPNLPAKERCLALMRVFEKRGGIGGGFRRKARERVPGEDDE